MLFYNIRRRWLPTDRIVKCVLLGAEHGHGCCDLLLFLDL